MPSDRLRAVISVASETVAGQKPVGDSLCVSGTESLSDLGCAHVAHVLQGTSRPQSRERKDREESFSSAATLLIRSGAPVSRRASGTRLRPSQPQGLALPCPMA